MRKKIMGNLHRDMIAVLAAGSLVLLSGAASAEQTYAADSGSTAPSAEAMAFDLVLVRPLGLAATALGVGLFVAQLPFDLFTWNVKDPAQRLIVAPAKFTFSRDLGQMN
jgi:hypothetical protein